MCRDDQTVIHFAVAQACRYGNQLLLGVQTSKLTNFISVLAFLSELQYCHVHAWINSSDNAITACKNLENFSPVALEFKRVVCVQF